uniref:Uncharacterized protein n=1 Tax=viral metagenome TaxID=1070528 RepID=A0A6C0C8W1_9ZZZZ
MSAHIFTLKQVQDSMTTMARKAKEASSYFTDEEYGLLLEEEQRRKTGQKYNGYYIWFTTEGNCIALEESTGFLRVWGWNFEAKFFIVDEEMFKASTEGIEKDQGDLELLFDSLGDKKYTLGCDQLQMLP